MVINFPNINPVLLEIGPIAIRWYSLAYIVGLLIGIKYLRFINDKYNYLALSNELSERIITWLILGIIIGGRLGYVLFYYPTEYFNDPLEILKTWHGGMSFHGGLIGISLASYFFCKRYKLAFLKLTDLLCCAAPIGIGLGRVANFINGELYGRATNQAWGVVFLNQNIARHPSQLYEALLEGLVLFMILFLMTTRLKKAQAPGLLTSAFLLLYSLFRIIIENYREPDIDIGLIYQNFTIGQLLSLPILLTAIIILANRHKKEIHW